METQPKLRDDLIEAKEIVAALAEVTDRLKPSDQRFLAGWQSYLFRTGDQAKIGRWRLALLRRLAGCYDIRAMERVTLDFSDVEREAKQVPVVKRGRKKRGTKREMREEMHRQWQLEIKTKWFNEVCQQENLF